MGEDKRHKEDRSRGRVRGGEGAKRQEQEGEMGKGQRNLQLRT